MNNEEFNRLLRKMKMLLNMSPMEFLAYSNEQTTVEEPSVRELTLQEMTGLPLKIQK
jgi:hypothetical protein